MSDFVTGEKANRKYPIWHRLHCVTKLDRFDLIIKGSLCGASFIAAAIWVVTQHLSTVTTEITAAKEATIRVYYTWMQQENMAAILPAQRTLWWRIPPVDLEAVFEESWAAQERSGRLAEDTTETIPERKEQ